MKETKCGTVLISQLTTSLHAIFVKWNQIIVKSGNDKRFFFFWGGVLFVCLSNSSRRKAVRLADKDQRINLCHTMASYYYHQIELERINDKKQTTKQVRVYDCPGFRNDLVMQLEQP